MTTQLQKRRGTTAEHSTFTGAEGEVTVDTTKDTAVVHDGVTAGGRPLAREDLNNVSTATVAAKLSGGTLTGNLTFGDNDKAIFGAGSDLQIYHNGTFSLIHDVGTGDLSIRGTNLNLSDSGGNGFIVCTDNGTGGEVAIYHNAVERLTTTSTGIDVTGTATMDGLTVGTSRISLEGVPAGSNWVYLGNETSTYTGKLTLQAGGGSAGFGGGLTLYGHSHATNAGDVVAGISANSGGSFRVDKWGTDGGGSVLDANGNGDISFYEDTGTTAKFFWDASAESLGIGTSTVDSILHLYKSDATVYNAAATDGQVGVGPTIYLENPANLNTTVGGQIVFGMRSTEEQARIGATGGTTPALTFGTADAERMRIDSAGTFRVKGAGVAGSTDAVQFNGSAPASAMTLDSSGNLLVGTTDSDPFNNNSDTSADNGISLKGGIGKIEAARSGGVVLDLNRTTSDGSIVDFKRSGTTVGSIGAIDGDAYIATNTSGIRFVDVNNSITPCDNAGATRNGLTSLGNSGTRFKDLYLSGGVYVGGTGAANYLDDYENGDWTPTFTSGVTSPTYTVQQASYTKIGNTVHFRVYIDLNTGTAAAAQLKIGGLPFTSSASSAELGGAYETWGSLIDRSTLPNVTCRVEASSTEIAFWNGTSQLNGNASGVTVGSPIILCGSFVV